MVEALSSNNGLLNVNPSLGALQSHPAMRDNEQDPLDTSPRAPVEPLGPPSQSPFGTLVLSANTSQAQVPHASEGITRLKSTNDRLASRRSTTIRPQWRHAPKILVVEDDMVYRQLSSKFLEKFGCETETVEDAHQAVEKMNGQKWVFFGHSKLLTLGTILSSWTSFLVQVWMGKYRPNHSSLTSSRKATSLIRQFDIYTPIISMTSNAQPQDVDSYLQSGMNDVLAKPFTKYGLFGILDKHLMHLKLIQLSAEIPRPIGVPPLSDQGVADVFATAAGMNMYGGMNGQNGLAMGMGMGMNMNTNMNMNMGNGQGQGLIGGINNSSLIGTANGNGNGTMGLFGGTDLEGDADSDYGRNPLAGMGWSDETYQLVLQVSEGGIDPLGAIHQSRSLDAVDQFTH